MQWQKFGQIFDFNSSPFAERYVSHAQSPQALVLKDRVRIYFSTRTNDAPGQFLSHSQYIEFDFDFKSVVGYSDHEVLPLGGLGCFDEHGIFPLSPVRVKDKIYAYTNGIARRTSVAVETGIGFAVSADDGRSFERLGKGPIVSATTYEPFLVGDAFVRFLADKFHMFYLYGKKWSEPNGDQPSERVYKIGHAISKDGLVWDKTNKSIISDIIDENECQALPTVIQIGDRYHMYFCFRNMNGFRDDRTRGYRIGYAYSDDLISWTRDDTQAGITVSDSGWDSEMMCYPNIFECNNEVYLLYNGNNFGREGFGIAKLTNG